MEWRAVPRSTLEVSEQGVIRHAVTKHVRKLSPDSGGYLRICVYFEGKRTSRLVHHMVLEAFVGPRPAGKECCHADDNSLNNAISNLSWGTKSQNMRDKITNGNNHQLNKTHCSKGRHEFTEANTIIRVRATGRSRICRTCENEYQRKRYYRTKQS